MENPKHPRRSSAAHTMAASLLVTLTTGLAAVATAQDKVASPGLIRTADRIRALEEAFWRCDYTATTRGIGATPMEICSDVYTALKDSKFSGSFTDLLAWWSSNKEPQHRRLEEGSDVVLRR